MAQALEQAPRLESEFRRLADQDGTLYLANPRPSGPVDFFIIAMEPSTSGGGKEAEAWIAEGARNFTTSREDFLLHHAVRSFLLGSGQTYHISDLSKGCMTINRAEVDRWSRWDRWFPALQAEMALVSKPGSKVIAVGRQVERFLSKRDVAVDLSVLHYARTGARHRWTSVRGREREFERFSASVELDDVLKSAAAVLAEAMIPGPMRHATLARIGRRPLSRLDKALLFTYKVAFKGLGNV